jgi:hypothetical protein
MACEEDGGEQIEHPAQHPLEAVLRMTVLGRMVGCQSLGDTIAGARREDADVAVEFAT